MPASNFVFFKSYYFIHCIRLVSTLNALLIVYIDNLLNIYNKKRDKDTRSDATKD